MPDQRFSLDILDVRIPCSVPWDSMRGDTRVRHCDQCKQNVYQLSELSKEEAEDLIRQKEGKLCVRFYRRRDGTVVTRRLCGCEVVAGRMDGGSICCFRDLLDLRGDGRTAGSSVRSEMVRRLRSPRWNPLLPTNANTTRNCTASARGQDTRSGTKKSEQLRTRLPSFGKQVAHFQKMKAS